MREIAQDFGSCLSWSGPVHSQADPARIHTRTRPWWLVDLDHAGCTFPRTLSSGSRPPPDRSIKPASQVATAGAPPPPLPSPAAPPALRERRRSTRRMFLLDILVEEALVEIVADGVVDEPLALLLRLAALVLEDHVVIPPPLDRERGAGAQLGGVKQRVALQD